jgi:HEAT repeat protein
VTDVPAQWALPQLLRAFRQGHRSHRGRVLRLIASLDDATLSSGSVLSAFRAALHGSDGDLSRRVGALVSARGLVAYGPDLVALLCSQDRRQTATAWLARTRLPFPKGAVLGLATDGQATAPTRQAALRLLRRRGRLVQDDRLKLLPLLSERALHGDLLPLLEPHADGAMVSAAVTANRRFGEAVIRRRRKKAGHPEKRGLLQRVFFFGETPSSIGEFASNAVAQRQRPFVDGIARLAIAAGSQDWLAALLPHLFRAGLTQPLKNAYLEHDVRRIAAPLLHLPAQGSGTAVKIELLGRLGAKHSVRFVAQYLPAFGRQATDANKAAILALAQLDEPERIAPFLDGALAAFRQSAPETPQTASPGHPSTWAATFQAATALRDPRFGAIGLELLSKRELFRVLVELDVVFAECLSTLAPLELEPTVSTVLRAPDAYPGAQRIAVEIVERCGFRELIEPMVALAGRVPTVASLAARTLRKMLRAEDAELARSFFDSATPDDASADALLARCEEVLPGDDQRAVAALLLERGVGGAKAQRRALHLLAEGDRETFLEVCIGLLTSAHPDVVTAALRAGVAAGLLEDGDRYAPQLLARLRSSIADSTTEGSQGLAQLRVVVDALIPAQGIPGALEASAASDLRQRVKKIGHWTELPTYLSLHRELTDLSSDRLGLLHGALLGLLGERTFFHPVTGAKGPYPGPLPRFDEAFRSASPFLQEGLFDAVCGVGYLRTERVLLRFLASPRAPVRARVLARLKRETFLSYSSAVLPMAVDESATVRLELVQSLARHELARFGDRLRPLLDDSDERVRLAAARTLGAWGDPGCLTRMVEFLSSDDGAIRREAAHALARLERGALVGRLAPLVAQADPRAAAAALLSLNTERLPSDDALKAAIFELAAKGRGPLRGLALRFLPILAESHLSEVVPLLADAQPPVRQAAAFVLARRDGRRHAAAIAELATRTSEPEVRREILALLAELGVPEAARGLVPLLLAEDPRVRAAVRRAVSAPRGFSLQPELEQTLKDGLDGKASPDAIRELVEVLHRDGDDDAFPTIASALRCEDRAVWEAVLAAARDRGPENAGQHFPKLLDVLKAQPALPSPLLTLALKEAERDEPGRERLQKTARHIAREKDGAETVKRRALLAAFTCSGDEGELARELISAASARVKELETLKPKKKTDVRAELSRVASTLTTSARIGAASTSDVVEGIRSVPDAALRGTLPWTLLDAGINAALEDGKGDVPKALLKALERLAPQGSTAATRLARVARDRLSPEEFLKLCASVHPADVPDLERSRLIAELRTDALNAKTFPKRLKSVANDRWQPVSQLLLASMEHWKPELRTHFGLLISELKRRKVDLQPTSWQDRRQAKAHYDALVGAKLRLEITSGSETLYALRPDGRLALMGAEGDVAGLQTLLAESRDDIAPLERLGEIGGAEAAAALSQHVEHRTAGFRAEVARALGGTGAAVAAHAALGTLLSDTEMPVVAAALLAVGRLGDHEHESAIVHWLGSEDNEVFSAACVAATQLELERARPLLRAAIVARDIPSQRRRRPVLIALQTLADASLLPDLIEIARRLETSDACDPLVPAIQTALGDSPTSAQMDSVGVLLGDPSPHAQEVAAHVFSARKYTKGLPALRSLVADPKSGAVARAYACDGLREMKDAESFAVILEVMTSTRDDGTPHTAISNLPSDIQQEGAQLLAATCPTSDHARVREILHDHLDAENHTHAGYAADGLALLPVDPETVRRLAAKLSPKAKTNWDASTALTRGLRALECLDPRAATPVAAAIWDSIVKDRYNVAALQCIEVWLTTETGKSAADVWAERLAQVLETPPNYHTRRRNAEILRILLDHSPAHAAPAILRTVASEPLALVKLCETEGVRPEWVSRLRGLLLVETQEVRVAARRALTQLPSAEPGAGAYARVIELAKADDPTCLSATSLLLRAPGGGQLSGELLVDLYRLETPAARAALFANLAALDDCVWPGFKRVFKLCERNLDPELFALQAFVLDQGSSWRKPSFRTLNYLRRRSYRNLKAMGRDTPELFLKTVGLLLGHLSGIGRRGSELLTRILREVPAAAAGANATFVAKLDNPFAADPETGSVPDLIDLSDEALLEPAPVPEPAPATTTSPTRSQAWKGPLHSELWTRDAVALVELLGSAPHSERVLQVILGLLRERVGDRILKVELEVFYGLLEHSSLLVSRFALGQIAARARQELVRFGLLVPLFARMIKGAPDWSALADLLWVLDDERADADRAGLESPLLELITAHPDDPGIGKVVTFFRRHFREALAPPLVDWPQALRLASAGRPDVRELGRDAVRTLNNTVLLNPEELPLLLSAVALIENAPDLVHEVLTHSPACPGGYRPPERWSTQACAQTVRDVGPVAFVALRRALLAFEEAGGLDPTLALALLGDAPQTTRRGRTLGMELFSSALSRGAIPVVDVTRFLLGNYAEDVVVWASEHLEHAATAGKLPNEGLYRLLDTTGQAVNAFARGLVTDHLRRFDAAELIVFCAESPDATTSGLGIQLYERELKDRGYDLAKLLPMFRILLYKVATARAEKERLLGTLRRWAFESAENARLVADVIAAFRRTEAKIDFTRAMTLLVLLGERYPEVKLPFKTQTTFGYRLPTQEVR